MAKAFQPRIVERRALPQPRQPRGWGRGLPRGPRTPGCLRPLLVTKMPGYTFHITEDSRSRRSCSVSGPTTPRSSPSGPSSSQACGRSGPVHCSRSRSTRSTRCCSCTKSGVEPLGLGLRDDMLNRALDFKKVLESVAGEVPNYMFLGDLNTMGMQYMYLRERDIAADLEVLKAAKFAEGRGMRLLVTGRTRDVVERGDEPGSLESRSGRRGRAHDIQELQRCGGHGARMAERADTINPARVDRRLLRSRLSLHGGPKGLAPACPF